MLKKLTVVLLIGVIMVFGFSSCFGKKYNVDYGDSKEAFRGAKDTYRAGQEVTLCPRRREVDPETDPHGGG